MEKEKEKNEEEEKREILGKGGNRQRIVRGLGRCLAGDGNAGNLRRDQAIITPGSISSIEKEKERDTFSK